MASLLDTLNQALGDQSVDHIGQQIGADPNQTRTAIQQALPVILGALGQEAADPQRAPGLHKALAEDHDGSVVDDPQAYLSGDLSQKPADGQAILNHVLGDRQAATQQALASKTGLDMGKIASLLPILAPLVMGLLGKQTRSGGFNPGDLASILRGETTQAAGASPDVGNILGSILGR